MTQDTQTQTLAEWAREEQLSLWYDLSDAIRYANNGTWSMQASNVARRLVGAARLVGPTPHGDAPWPLLAGGVYEAVLGAGGMSPEMPDEAEWRESEELMAENGGTRATCGPEFAATVAAIKTERETNWIAGGDE